MPRLTSIDGIRMDDTELTQLMNASCITKTSTLTQLHISGKTRPLSTTTLETIATLVSSLTISATSLPTVTKVPLGGNDIKVPPSWYEIRYDHDEIRAPMNINGGEKWKLQRIYIGKKWRFDTSFNCTIVTVNYLNIFSSSTRPHQHGTLISFALFVLTVISLQ
jgi:hypothetical protein